MDGTLIFDLILRPLDTSSIFLLASVISWSPLLFPTLAFFGSRSISSSSKLSAPQATSQVVEVEDLSTSFGLQKPTCYFMLGNQEDHISTILMVFSSLHQPATLTAGNWHHPFITGNYSLFLEIWLHRCSDQRFIFLRRKKGCENPIERRGEFFFKKGLCVSRALSNFGGHAAEHSGFFCLFLRLDI